MVRAAAPAMGTRFEVVLWGGDAPRLLAVAEAALERVCELERRYSRFRADSVLSFVNAHAGERAVGVDADTFELLAACARVWRESDGAFDPTVGPLMRAWGFHGEPGDTAAAAACVGMDGVLLDEGARTVRFTRPGASLDLGGIAKGQALDEAAAIVREAGVACGLLHGGTSTVVAIGAPPGEAGWVVEVRGSPYRVALRDRAMSVSEPSGRVVERDGRRLGHVLDPRSGAPVDGASLACVVGESAMETDAWSTALLVLGARPPRMPGQLTTLLPQQGGAWAVEGPDERLFWRSDAGGRAG
ncbi:MAG: FAD:protein FMN transferase [Phycisphaeraceae bacterium]|nr:FAD:protein FMN transferase [Phycisphaeraceae bacterium]